MRHPCPGPRWPGSPGALEHCRSPCRGQPRVTSSRFLGILIAPRRRDIRRFTGRWIPDRGRRLQPGSAEFEGNDGGRSSRATGCLIRPDALIQDPRGTASVRSHASALDDGRVELRPAHGPGTHPPGRCLHQAGWCWRTASVRGFLQERTSRHGVHPGRPRWRAPPTSRSTLTIPTNGPAGLQRANAAVLEGGQVIKPGMAGRPRSGPSCGRMPAVPDDGTPGSSSSSGSSAAPRCCGPGTVRRLALSVDAEARTSWTATSWTQGPGIWVALRGLRRLCEEMWLAWRHVLLFPHDAPGLGQAWTLARLINDGTTAVSTVPIFSRHLVLLNPGNVLRLIFGWGGLARPNWPGSARRGRPRGGGKYRRPD